ncbi:DUF3017 domain-containing protein [Nakamurella endophytica]|uniref:DUF3017 domain-containing protein n=1 Tax=Nakamurella endophytica TaxID=1748367 RepID=A0A917WG55_9ACTN|nr:DUF3017 domain-containing protein [Nakamurella endophytica]GGM02530.1 hypothetical protein GCM10011594_23290 [Nakamurella endophytica]
MTTEPAGDPVVREPAGDPVVRPAGDRVRPGSAERAGSRTAGGRWSAVPFAAVVAVVVVALVLIGSDHWRRGSAALAAAAVLAAALRLVLPVRVIGLLAVRGRLFDVLFLLVLGAVLGTMVALG